ncbi:helix-turn-helix transcriptional regulator [Bacillus sp. FJAT-49705]|uniref:Helix-turn-helix transcriptional regulator n=1 Tax=Cytobacillus citreus TaxID=2833586 RepID=A0ABS5NLH6_9BACI|nr:helix-turn-helix transcriptional regulator [Cytobacillus citreus]MBS4188670.1 helix-turn-helix transcriptional regulator [Cytobacillus citreus]
MSISFGEFIAQHRKLSGFKSQRQLAEKSGVSSATISRIESEIQKPEVDTLKSLASHLTSTSFVELMVVCGYWDKEELLEDNLTVQESIETYVSAKDSSEEEFVEKIDLTDEDLLKQFDLRIDGRSLTKGEAKGIIAYVRSLRQM